MFGSYVIATIIFIWELARAMTQEDSESEAEFNDFAQAEMFELSAPVCRPLCLKGRTIGWMMHHDGPDSDVFKNGFCCRGQTDFGVDILMEDDWDMDEEMDEPFKMKKEEYVALWLKKEEYEEGRRIFVLWVNPDFYGWFLVCVCLFPCLLHLERERERERERF